MKTVLILTLLLALGACASGRLEQMEERIAALEEQVEGWANPPAIFNPDGCIRWPGLWDTDIEWIPSFWPLEEPVPQK